jgi:adenosylcobinamide-GDP ribazoletransferase
VHDDSGPRDDGRHQDPIVFATELRRLLMAVGYFTRVPVPAGVWSAQEVPHATRYFPLIGGGVGAVAAGVLLAAGQLWSLPLAVLLSMVTSLLLTGALHEDGLADCADGFGGGTTRERVLEIMQDPRIGSFGALALALTLLLKAAALLELARIGPATVAMALVFAHAASRAVALLVMLRLPYLRGAGPSKSRAVVSGMGLREAGLGLASGVLLTGALACASGVFGPAQVLVAIAAAGLLLLCALSYLQRRIGGYTGDCLGATQQLAEIAIYLALLGAA